MEPAPSIHLHIDRVILDGLPFIPADAGPIRAGLEAQLTRIVGENFATGPHDSLSVDMLRTVPLVLPPEFTPTSFGHQVATILSSTFSQAVAVPPPSTQ